MRVTPASGHTAVQCEALQLLEKHVPARQCVMPRTQSFFVSWAMAGSQGLKRPEVVAKAGQSLSAFSPFFSLSLWQLYFESLPFSSLTRLTLGQNRY